jgi:hypothetical protein
VLIHLVGEIEIAVLLKKLPVTGAASFAQHPLGFIVRNRLGSNRRYVPMHAHLRRFTLGDVQIRGLLSDYDLQKFIKISHGQIADYADVADKRSLA